MRGNAVQRPLGGVPQELARLVAAVSALEVRLAGSLEADSNELLARLAATARHLASAQAALAGVSTMERGAEAEHLQGSSRAVPIQDLLCFLSTTQKSGVLRVEADEERFLLQLDQGAVVYTTGDAPPTGESLRELLARRGVHSTELLGSLPERAPSGAWTDPNLLGTSWISRDSLASAIHEQTRLSFFRLCAARHARFRFFEGAEIQNVLPIKQSAMELLLEYSRVHDEGLCRLEAGADRPEEISAATRVL